MQTNYKKLQILRAIDILTDERNISFSRTKDIVRLIGGRSTINNTSRLLSRYLNFGYIKIKKGKRYDKNVKRQRQICYQYTKMGELILEKLLNRYSKGKDLNLKFGHLPRDVDFSKEGKLLEGYKEMKEQGLL